jgi:hypothetical protein
LTLNALGQDKRVVLQIDTLILNGYDNFSIRLNGQGFANLIDLVDDSLYVRQVNSNPNFICPLTLKSDSSHILISLDDQGGYLSITDVFSSHYDTLKINKLEVFSNCYCDTTFTRIDYYDKKEDGTSELSKVENTKTLEKIKCKNKPPDKVNYTINNFTYSVSLNMQTDFGIQISQFNGETKPVKNKGYFGGQSTTIHYINVGTIRIKNGT